MLFWVFFAIGFIGLLFIPTARKVMLGVLAFVAAWAVWDAVITETDLDPSQVTAYGINIKNMNPHDGPVVAYRAQFHVANASSTELQNVDATVQLFDCPTDLVTAGCRLLSSETNTVQVFAPPHGSGQAPDAWFRFKDVPAARGYVVPAMSLANAVGDWSW